MRKFRFTLSTLILTLVLLCFGVVPTLADDGESATTMTIPLSIESSVALYDAEGNNVATLQPTDIPFEMILSSGQTTTTVSAEIVDGIPVTLNNPEGKVLTLSTVRLIPLEPQFTADGQQIPIEPMEYFITRNEVLQALTDMSESYQSLLKERVEADAEAQLLISQQELADDQDDQSMLQLDEKSETGTQQTRLNQFPADFVTMVLLTLILVTLVFSVALGMTLMKKRVLPNELRENWKKNNEYGKTIIEKLDNVNTGLTTVIKDSQESAKKLDAKSIIVVEHKANSSCPLTQEQNATASTIEEQGDPPGGKTIAETPEEKRYKEDIQFFNSIARINKKDIWENRLIRAGYGYCLLQCENKELGRYVSLPKDSAGSYLACVWNSTDNIPYLIPSSFGNNFSDDDISKFYEIDSSKYTDGEASYCIIECAKLEKKDSFYVFEEKCKGLLEKFSV